MTCSPQARNEEENSTLLQHHNFLEYSVSILHSYKSICIMITFFICSQPTITGRHTDYLKVLMHLIIMDRQSGQGFGRWRQSVTWWICMDSSMNSHPWGGLGVPGQSNQYPSIFVLFLTLPLIGVSLY